MKKIDRLVILKFIGPFIITFFITLFIIVMQFLWKYVDDMIGKGLEWYVIAELIFYASASFVPLALPLSVLLSSIMTFGSFGESYELVAAKSSGVSLVRFMASTIVAVSLISVAAFFFSNNILPHANLKFGTLLYDIRHQKPAVNIKAGIFYKEIEGFSIKVGSKGSDNKTINDIIVYDHSSGRGNDNILIAEKGEMYSSDDGHFLILRLFNGKQYREVKQKGDKHNLEHVRTYFNEWEKRFDLSDFSWERTDEKFWKNHYNMLNLRQLTASMDTLNLKKKKRLNNLAANINQYFTTFRYNIDSLTKLNICSEHLLNDYNFDSLTSEEQTAVMFRSIKSAQNIKSISGVAARDLDFRNKNMKKHELAWHRKFTFSFACLVLFFIGAPLGAIIRIGGLGMPMLISVIFFVFFHIISIMGEKIAEKGEISALVGMWLSTAVLLPLGAFLTYKAMRDSVLFNLEWYYSLINKMFKKHW